LRFPPNGRMRAGLGHSVMCAARRGLDNVRHHKEKYNSCASSIELLH
jgi:hypothetical protein